MNTKKFWQYRVSKNGSVVQMETSAKEAKNQTDKLRKLIDRVRK